MVQESGIQPGHPACATIEALVGTYHLLDATTIPGADFWSLTNATLSRAFPSECNDIKFFEDAWHDVFAMLPLLEIDTEGMLSKGSRLDSTKDTPEKWSLVKKMLDRLFALWADNGGQVGINPYIRSTFSRCYRLIRVWGWHKSETVLSLIFDFFARNNLGFLKNEDSGRPSSFLETAKANQYPPLEPADRSFQIFLKLLATGLIAMREVYPDKKIRNIAWRFVPNHGRTHKKDEDLRSDDLDALRNHHELLCVLYYASPPGFRPNLNVIRNLLDFKSSHMEICRVNIRAWTDLARFHVQNDEPSSSVAPFCLWFNDVLRSCIDLHRLARTEAQEILETPGNAFNRQPMITDALESTVSSNQRQVEALLQTALERICDLLKNSKSFKTAVALFRGSSISSVFKMFDPNQKRIDRILILGLGVYKTYFELVANEQTDSSTQKVSEDSQDYGEWPIEESADEGKVVEIVHAIDETLVEPVWQILSSCFGADRFHDDELLLKALETWIKAASLSVKTGQRDWSQYLDHHSPISWYQLRDTDQTRIFTPVFLSLIVEHDSETFETNEFNFLSAWIESLMEREPLLKYQHRFTTALLNTQSEHPLTQNLPFAKNIKSRTYEITLSQFRDRRLALISSTLSNIRDSYEKSFATSDVAAARQRQKYTSLVRHLMNAMKKKYKEIQDGSSLRGSYVEFVQAIVQFLQQYTADICPIDKYFTDSAAFPLPTTDPLYVVGRLKSYQLKSGEVAAQKQLAVFVQTVCQRAAIEGQQDYLVDQLKTSLQGIGNPTDESRPSLQRLLIEAVFPSYLEAAASTDCGWVLARPVLDVLPQILDRILFDLSLNHANLEAIKHVLAALLTSTHRATIALIPDGRSTLIPQTSLILAAFIRIVTAAVPTIDYLEQIAHHCKVSIDCITLYARLITLIPARMRDQHFTDDLLTLSSPSPQPQSQASTLTSLAKFTTASLHDALSSIWSRSPSTHTTGTYTYTIHRGTGRREVHVDLRSQLEEQSAVLWALDGLRAVLERMPALRGLLGGEVGEGDRDRLAFEETEGVGEFWVAV